ncbi:MAG: ChaN family lipoprotein [Syntrophobacteraceae bacterium]|nr:ChaN family lipoprotein [Syntrophobacteraceae bacterium]
MPPNFQLHWSRHKRARYLDRPPCPGFLSPGNRFAAACRVLRLGVFACGALFVLAGCCAAEVSLLPQRPDPALPLHPGEVIETATGRVIGMDRLVEKLSKVAVVYIGETHTNVEDHKVQLEILRKLSRISGCVELAMEMFPANAQPVLDRYIAGKLSERTFLREANWGKVWGFPYSLYKGQIDWQRQRHMPVVGLNAPYPVVKKIARHGLRSLSFAERLQVARVFHLDDPSDRKRVKKAFLEHGRFEIKDFETFYEAQLAWEETMAQTLARRLGHTRCEIVVVLGKGHIGNRYGVPYLTRLRRPEATYRTVVPVSKDYPFHAITPGLADYVVITGRSKPSAPPRLGVMIDPRAPGRGVRLAGVIPGTPADAGHLRKGDVILSVNGKPVKNAKELRQALARDGPACSLVIQRNNARLRVEVAIGR